MISCIPYIILLQDEHRKLRGNKADGELLDFEDYKQMEFTMTVRNKLNHVLCCSCISSSIFISAHN